MIDDPASIFKVKCITVDTDDLFTLETVSNTASLDEHCHYPVPQSTAALNNCESLKPYFHNANGKKFMKITLLYIIWYFTFNPVKTNIHLNIHTNSLPTLQGV